MEPMTEYSDWKITATFTVRPGDTEGVLTEALFEAALRQAPSQAKGMVARADTGDGKVWITFTLVGGSREFADEVAADFPERVRDAILSGDEVCVSAC